MREIVLGTAGHVDHGKTSLVRALTGIETDRLKEEKKRGITIELGFAYLDLPCGHRLGIVDVPGHEKFVKNMVAGVSGMDLVAFIVAADEGIMPQTREHFEICRLLGVKAGIVVLTKIDMVEPEWLEMVEEEVRDFCADSFLEEAPCLHVSSITGQGIDELRTVLNDFVAAQEFREAHGPFRLSVDRIFAMKGFGAVITGTSISGRVSIGEPLRLYPSELQAKVRGLQVHSTDAETVEAGHRTAINLQGVEILNIDRGMVAATPGCLSPSYMLDCDFFYLSSNTKPLKHRTRVRVHLGTGEYMARISLLDRDELLPGHEAPVQLLFEEPVVVWPGDRYVVRSYSPIMTIGGGAVLDNLTPRKRKRLSDSDRNRNREQLRLLQRGEIEDRILYFLELSGSIGLTQDELAIRLGLFGKPLKKTLTAPLSTGKIAVVDSGAQRYLARLVIDRLEGELLAVLKEYHTQQPLQIGLSKEELRSSVGRGLDGRVFQFCMAELIKQEQIVQEESTVRLFSHSVALQADEQEVRAELSSWYQKKGLATATLRETMDHFSDYPEKVVVEVMALLVRDGALLKVSESLYYDVPTMELLKQQVTDFIQAEGEIDAPRFKNLTGLTRKFSIPLLEYLDRIKLTIRIGDVRVLRKSAG